MHGSSIAMFDRSAPPTRPSRRRLWLLACAAGALLPGASPVNAQIPVEQGANWKEGGVCYEVFVRSFKDSDGDGVGDLKGLIEKLDYINDGDPAGGTDLGASCIWLMPIAESPSYHGYDVVDYYRVDREYGTNDDFELLVEEAHRRGIRVLVDMVINHMSSDHPIFQEALRDTDSPYRSWFRWTDAGPGEPNEWGGYNWHASPVRDEHYYGFFWSGMPDLNYRSPAVMEEMKRVAEFWLNDLGADGFRLDAIIHLVEEDGMIAHAPGTHDVLREYGAHIRRVAPEAFTIGEAWGSIDQTMAYYPDQLDAYFAFEVADSIISAVRNGSSAGLLPPVLRLQQALPAGRYAPFLRNHDQTRTATEFGGDVERARLAATLLLTFPGLPFVYYGEELGMTGDKPDPRLRTPMHWSRRPGVGFTEGTAWAELQPDSMTANVEAQESDPGSLLNHYRRLIHLRGSEPALARGELIPLETSSESVAAYLRRDGQDVVLVVVNLGEEPAVPRLGSAEGAVPVGTYRAEGLVGASGAAPLRVLEDGRIRDYVPFASLEPLSGHVLKLTADAARGSGSGDSGR